MERIRVNKDTLTMKYPAMWQGALWREGLPSGNGTIGANFFGGVKHAAVIVNHCGLWTGTPAKPLPDVHHTLEQARKALDEGRFDEASWALTGALQEAGYDNERGYPLPLAKLEWTLEDLPGFAHYLRAVDMASGQVSAEFEEDGAWVRQDLFVSRGDDTVYLRMRAQRPLLNAAFSMDVCPPGRPNNPAYEAVAEKKRVQIAANQLIYQSVNTDGLPYGAVAKVETDGTLASEKNQLKVTGASEILVKVQVFVQGQGSVEALCAALENHAQDYDSAFACHRPLHEPLYRSADLDLMASEGCSNEELLLKAYDGQAPLELVEKLWRFGRYLFVSGSAADGWPFPLYGLWAGDYRLMWSHNMANENVQMIYWHTNVGNLEAFNRPLMRYYNTKMDTFRENAQKLYGLPGIWVPAGTTPNMAQPNQIVPVIMNWSGAAGWLARHYYQHYLYTRDETELLTDILPFMKAAADFYEAFIVFDENGQVKMYPSISPENTPLNFIPKENEDMAHPMPTAVNATMDLAIVKELFTHLIAICTARGLYGEKLETWQRIVDAVPPYRVNKDGAIREWQDDRFEDRYYHRHLSHIYPVFPGDEVTTQDEQIGAFERAVDLREIGAQTGWSFAHMAAIYARFGRGDDALGCLDNLSRTCLQNNFFTLHNDWRQMDISLDMERSPIQLDAAMGCVNALQEMILFASEKLVKLLPALPGRMARGRVENWQFPGGSVNMQWDTEKGSFEAELTAAREIDLQIVLPKQFAQVKYTMPCEQSGDTLSVRLCAGQTLRLSSDETAI